MGILYSQPFHAILLIIPITKHKVAKINAAINIHPPFSPGIVSAYYYSLLYTLKYYIGSLMVIVIWISMYKINDIFHIASHPKYQPLMFLYYHKR